MTCRALQLLFAVLVGLSLGSVGCIARTVHSELHSLTGTVTRDGRAVTGGGLLFTADQASAAGLIVNAIVQQDGSSVAQTLRTGHDGVLIVRPGAPTGTYRIIYHPPGNSSKTGLEVELAERVAIQDESKTVTLSLPRELPAGSGAPRDDDPTNPRPPAASTPSTSQ